MVRDRGNGHPAVIAITAALGAGLAAARSVFSFFGQQTPAAPDSVSGWILTFGVFTPTAIAVYYFLNRSDKKEEAEDQRHAEQMKIKDETIHAQQETITQLIAEVARLRERHGEPPFEGLNDKGL